MEDPPRFSRWVKQLRADHDLTQEALAERVGCAPQTIRMFEGGHRRPSREMAERLAAILDVPDQDRPAFVRAARFKGTALVERSAADDRPDAANAAGAAARHHHNPPLPVPATPLIGRQREYGEIINLVTDPACRLVTVVGPGGAGKTRLALQVATDLGASFADGTAFVSLGSVISVADVAPAVAEALGARLQGGVAPEDEVVQLLRDREMLVVLDNLEHLLDAAALIARMIAAAPRVRWLATSRERLRLQAEWAIEVGGLAVPHDQTYESVAHSEAVLLFVERSRRVSGDFMLTPHNQAAVAEICRRLDGLPLALELAAAHASFLPPAALLQRLDQALPLLVDGARDLPLRQRTMRAAIEWSYTLLPDDERALFERLAVFVGGFSLEAAEAVGVATQAWPVLALLRRLVEQSLVVREADAHGAVRYRLLEPIRQFALEQLMSGDGGTAVRQLHATYFVALAEQAMPKLQSPDQVAWLATLEREHPNLQVAMAWLLEQRDLEHATRMCWALWVFLWMRGHLSEGRRWIEQVLAYGDDARPDVRARTLVTALVIGFGQGAYSWAATFVDECLALCHELGDQPNLAHATALAGLVAAGLQQDALAEQRMASGVQQYLAVGETWGAAMLLTYWSAIPRKRGDYGSAKRLTEQALALAQHHGDRVTAYSSLYNLASLAQAQHSYTEARDLFRDALALAVEVGDHSNIAYCWDGLAAVAAAQGDFERAVRLWGAAAALLDRSEAAIYTYAPDRDEYEQMVADARSRLPATRWSALWDEGRALGFERALSYALQPEARPAPSSEIEQHGLRIAATDETLTPREIEVLRRVAQGSRTAEVAAELGLSALTVNVHLRAIYRKLGVRSRTAATRVAIEQHLV